MDSSDQRKGIEQEEEEEAAAAHPWRVAVKTLRAPDMPEAVRALEAPHQEQVRRLWSQSQQRLIRMTRLGCWVLYNLGVKELKTWYARLMRERGMAQWPEYGGGDREEVRSLIGKVKEEYWRRMPEHRRQKVIASLGEKRRLKEERERRLAAAADVAASCCSAGGRG